MSKKKVAEQLVKMAKEMTAKYSDVLAMSNGWSFRMAGDTVYFGMDFVFYKHDHESGDSYADDECMQAAKDTRSALFTYISKYSWAVEELRAPKKGGDEVWLELEIIVASEDACAEILLQAIPRNVEWV